MRRLVLLTALAVVMFTGSVRAQPMYRSIGAGGVSCGTWAADRADRRSEFGWINEHSWVLGFLSGVGYQGIREGIDPLHGWTPMPLQHGSTTTAAPTRSNTLSMRRRRLSMNTPTEPTYHNVHSAAFMVTTNKFDRGRTA